MCFKEICEMALKFENHVSNISFSSSPKYDKQWIQNVSNSKIFREKTRKKSMKTLVFIN